MALSHCQSIALLSEYCRLIVVSLYSAVYSPGRSYGRHLALSTDRQTEISASESVNCGLLGITLYNNQYYNNFYIDKSPTKCIYKNYETFLYGFRLFIRMDIFSRFLFCCNWLRSCSEVASWYILNKWII